MSISFRPLMKNIQRHKINKNNKIKEYIAKQSLLNEKRQEALGKKIPVLSDEAGNILQIISYFKKPEYILEIGCGIGYSTYYILSGCEKNSKRILYYGLDLNRERLKQADEFISREFSQLISIKKFNVNFIAGNALKIIPDIDLRFNLVFIDAAKLEYPQYLDILLPKLVRGSVIVADNIFYSNKIFNNNISPHDYNSVCGIKEYINRISDSNYFDSTFLNAGDGVAVSYFKGNINER